MALLSALCNRLDIVGLDVRVNPDILNLGLCCRETISSNSNRVRLTLYPSS